MFIAFIIVGLVLMIVVYYIGYNKGYDKGYMDWYSLYSITVKTDPLQMVNQVKKIVDDTLDN